jgi:hypothetical protein
MKSSSLPKLTGILFILGAISVNIPYALLIAHFNYPDILRRPAGEILVAFAQGGSSLIYTWLAFAWTGLPIFFAILLFPKAIRRTADWILGPATIFGVVGAVVQMIGLLRWVFVVPGLAQAYTEPQASPAAQEAAALIFQAFHQLGGVLLGEHLGQLFTIFWMSLVSLAILRSRLFAPWTGWLGLVAAGVYFLAQGELLATILPDFPQVGPAGLAGSLLWLAWMVVLGILLLRLKEPERTPMRLMDVP